MGFYQRIKSDYNEELVTSLKRWTSNIRKLASLKNRLCFLHRCKKMNLLPRHITNGQKNINNLITLENMGKLRAIDNFKCKLGKKMLNLEISLTVSSIANIKNNINNCIEFAKRNLPHNIFREFSNRQHTSYNKLHKKFKFKHIRHLENLKCKSKNFHKPNEKMFKNLTDVEIPEHVQYCLSLGPKFWLPVTPKNIKVASYLADVEDILSLIPTKQSNILRAKVTNILTNFLHNNQPSDNSILKLVKNTKAFLKQYNNILILNADKGNVTVAMYKEKYLEKMYELLKDPHTYKQLDKDPTLSFERRNNSLVNELNNLGYIDQSTAKKLRTYKSVCPKIYGLPKIHKGDCPLRPIVASVNAPTQYLSKFIANILKLSFDNYNEFRIKNTFDFAKVMNGRYLPEGFVVASFDVVSLFTNIPISLIVNILEQNFELIKKNCNIPKPKFIEMIKFIFETTVFSFEGSYFLQTFGTPMGSNLSPILADIVMNSLLKYVINNVDFQFPFISQYVDDIICALPNNRIEETLNIFNSFNTKLIFTIEKEDSHNSVPFLDTRVIRTPDGIIKLDWYQKSTNSGRYLHFNSNHPLKHKINLVLALKNRIEKISSNTYYYKNLKILYNTLLNNDYPPSFLKKLIFSTSTPVETKKSEEIKYVKLQYIRRVTPLIDKLFRPFNMVIANYNKYTIGSIFSKVKDRTNNELLSDVVYSISCTQCNKSYVGQTSQRLKNRISQHKSDIRVKPKACALSQHVIDLGHTFDFSNTLVLAHENNYKKRLFLEMFYINKMDTINFKKDTSGLSSIYCSILN